MKTPLKNWLVIVLIAMGIVNFINYLHYQRYVAGSLFFALTLLLAASIGFGYNSNSAATSKIRRVVSLSCAIIGILLAVVLFVYSSRL